MSIGFLEKIRKIILCQMRRKIKFVVSLYATSTYSKKAAAKSVPKIIGTKIA